MKIIGHIPHHGYGEYDEFIVQATKIELINLCGYFTGRERQCPEIGVGAQIKVSEMYRQLYKLASAQKEVEAASATLHSVANLVKIINPIIEAVIKPEEKETKP